MITTTNVPFTRRTAAIVGAATIGAAILLALGLSPMASGAADRDPDISAIPQLTRPAVKGDEIPAKFDISIGGEGGIMANSTRLIGKDANATYWGGYDRAGNLCLISVLAKDDYWGSTCDSLGNFSQRGLSLGLTGSDEGKYAASYLIPDGVSMEKSSYVTAIAPNLLVGDGRRAAAAARVVKSDNTQSRGGQPFAVYLFEANDALK